MLIDSPVAIDPVFAQSVRLGLAVLLLSACWHKLRGQAVFRATLAEYQLLPHWLVRPAAVAITGFELGAGLALLILPESNAVAAAAVLLSVYAFAMGINIARGRVDIDCGCSGPAARQPLSIWLVVRNVMIVGFAVLSLGEPVLRELLWIDWLSTAMSLVVACLLYVGLNQLIANIPQLETLR